MTISVECDGCGKAYKIADDKAGKKFKCKDCGEVVAVPDEDFEDAFEVIDESDDEPEVRPKRQRSGSATRGGDKRTRRRSAGNDDEPRAGGGSGGGINIGKLIGRIVLFGTLGVALLIAGLDFRQKQQATSTGRAVDAAMNSNHDAEVDLKNLDNLIQGNPKREEEGTTIILTWGIVRDYTLTLKLMKFVGGGKSIIGADGPGIGEGGDE